MSRLSITRPGDRESQVAQLVAACGGDLRALRPQVAPKSGKDVAFNSATGQYELAETTHNADAGMFADCWKEWDDAINEPYKNNLVVFADAYAAGRRGLGSQNDAFGTLMYQWSLREMVDGLWETDMFVGEDKSTNDTPIYSSNLLPLPIDHAKLKTYIRTIEAAKRGAFGSGKGAVDIESDLLYDYGFGLARRKEFQMLNGLTNKDGSLFTYNNNYCYGYRNAPNRLRKEITESWELDAATATEIRTEVLGWCDDMKHIVGNRKELVLYINADYEAKMSAIASDYDIKLTLKQWMIETIPQLKEIKVAEFLPGISGGAAEILLVHVTPRTVQIIEGFGPSTIMWKSESGMEHNILLMNMQVPLVKYASFQDVTPAGVISNTSTTGILQARVGEVPSA